MQHDGRERKLQGKQYYIYPYTKENYPDQSTSKYEYLPYLRKWVDPTFTAGNANVNFIVYRYADLLLTLAEAANELGGTHTREAVGYVNEVLVRPDASHVVQDGAPSRPGRYPFVRIVACRSCRCVRFF